MSDGGVQPGDCKYQCGEQPFGGCEQKYGKRHGVVDAGAQPAAERVRGAAQSERAELTIPQQSLVVAGDSPMSR